MPIDDDKLDYIKARLDIVVDRMNEEMRRTNDILHENTLSLKDHMRRTDLLEEWVRKIDVRLSPVELELIKKRAVSQWISGKLKFLAKLGGAVTALGALGMLVKQYIHFISF